MISIQRLSKSYGSKLVLKDINMDFEKGKVYGIVSQNGAGKTTLFRCLAGLENYTGDIHSQGILKHKLGFLSVDTYFMDKMTAEEYVFLLTEARGVKVKDLQQRNIFQLPLKDYISNYSTGMKKKLALMAVLLQNNDVFILDEPFNGIDLESSMRLTSIMERLKSLGKTILISSHIFSTLKESCDTIFVLQYGHIVKKVQQKDFNTLEEELKARVSADFPLEKLLEM